jgi:membrane protease YdiL (CAAX protease family)
MWCPGVAAILTRLITQRNVRGQGWKPRTLKLLGLAYILPVLYALPVYLLAWGIGLGGFDPSKWAAQGSLSPAAGLLILASVGVLVSFLSATGEEIGWRGLLVPELAKLTSFRNTVLISAAIWAAWHMPLIIGANYHGEGTPIAYSIACFIAMVVALSTIMAWITLKSGSLWPAALLHATHNLFVQAVFDTSTVNRGSTGWLTGEFGIGLVVTIAIAAALLLRYGGVPQTQANPIRS